MPRLSGEERAARDTLVVRLYLAGVVYRDIAKQTGLSLGGVHKVIKRQLRQSADRRDDLAEDAAIEAYLRRMETLLAATFPAALKGNARSAEQVRRILDSMARIQGLFPSLAERVLPLRDRDGDDDDEEDEALIDPNDELARYRLA